MILNWHENGIAFSHYKNNDLRFFEAIKLSKNEIGITSFYGADIVYFDLKIYDSDYNAIKGKRIN